MIGDNRVETLDGRKPFGDRGLDADPCADVGACRHVAVVHHLFEAIDSGDQFPHPGCGHRVSDKVVFERRRRLRDGAG
jgi:hypothetical protein